MKNQIKKIVAFIDLLGFKNYTDYNIATAHNLLVSNVSFIIEERIRDNESHPPSSYSNKNTRKLSEKNLLTSFEYLLPISDSFFIISPESKADIFVEQLSSFLIKLFYLNMNAYNKNNNENATEVNVKHYYLNKNGINSRNVKEFWPPVFFRGGISFGEIILEENFVCIKNYKKNNTVNFVGSAVVSAVELEKIGEKGPRIFCDKNFYCKLSTEKKDKYCVKIKDSIYEILWPIAMFIDENGNKTECNSKFDEILEASYKLWKSFNHRSFGVHYWEFMKLVIKSIIKYCNNSSEKRIMNKLKKLGMEEFKINDILEK